MQFKAQSKYIQFKDLLNPIESQKNLLIESIFHLTKLLLNLFQNILIDLFYQARKTNQFYHSLIIFKIMLFLSD